MPKGPEISLPSQEELSQLPTHAIIAYAARCALRAFPFLCQLGYFPWPPKLTPKHLVGIEITLISVALASIGAAKEIEDDHYAAAEGARDGAPAIRATAAIYAITYAGLVARASAAGSRAVIVETKATTEAKAEIATRAKTAVTEAKAATADAAASAAEAVVTAASDINNVRVTMRIDFEWLKEHSLSQKLTALEFFYLRPLWIEDALPEVNSILTHFQNALETLERTDIWDWYRKFLYGEKIDWEFLSHRLITCYEQYRAQESASSKEPPSKKPSAETWPTFIQEDQTRVTPLKPPYLGHISTTRGDAPAAEDHLGRNGLVDSLGFMFTAKEQETPFTVALLAPWGSGKSSVVALLKKWFTEHGFHCPKAPLTDQMEMVWADFNAWEYEHTQNIRAGLAHEVVRALVQDVKWWQRPRLIWKFACREHAVTLRKAFYGTSLAVIGLLVFLCLADLDKVGYWQSVLGTSLLAGFGIFAYSMWQPFKTLLEHPLATEIQTYLQLPNYSNHLGEIPVIKQHLRTLCDLQLGEPRQKRLIVFVDDLDRCAPKLIMDVFDAIRLIMDIPGVIVMVMIDPRIAMSTVADEYQKFAEEGRDKFAVARDYLGKIIQLPISLEHVSKAGLEDYVNHLFKDTVTETPATKPATNKLGQTPSPSAESKPEKQTPPSVGNETPLAESTTNTPPVSESSTPPPASDSERTEPEPERKMEDTADERELFHTLASEFEMVNPRLLVRLRNSFRFLKSLNARTKKDFKPEQLLVVLFVKEFLNEQPAKQRGLMCQIIFENSQVNNLPEPLKDKVEFAANQLKEVFAEDVALRDRVSDFVQRVVLPYHEPSPQPAEAAKI